MRNLNHNNITFTTQQIQRTKEGYAQIIDFSKEKEDIIILSHQPGLGKTYTVLEFIKNHPDSIYLTNRHDIIKENVKHWNRTSYSHWMGFNRICKNRTLKKIHETYHINPSILCTNCKNTRCSYRWQFTRRQRVFAPYEYLSLGQILNNLPEYLFLDEQKLSTDTLTFNQKETIDWLNIIQTHSKMPQSYTTQMQNNNYQFFLNTGFNDIQTIYYEDSLKNAYQSKQMNDIKKITNINPYLLEKYFKMANCYNDFSRKEYYFPLCYNAFEVLNKTQKQTKLIFMDASFNYRLFRYLLESFNGEIGFNNPVSIKIFYSNVTNKNTKVYSMRLSDKYQSWFPKASFKFTKSMMNWLPYHINKIKEIYGEENVGIITFKKIANSGYFKLLGYDIQHYGGLRSSNTFRNKKAIIIIGTYFQSEDDIFEYLEKIFDIHDKGIIIEERETEETITKLLADVGIKSKQKKPTLYDKVLEPKKRRRYSDNQDDVYDKGWYLEGYTPPKTSTISLQDQYDIIKYRIYPVEWIQKVIWDEEIYQAFHRNRGILNDRVIFAYCWFPLEILNEFKVKTIKRDKNDEEQLWKKLDKKEEKRKLMESFIKEFEELVKKNNITLQQIQNAITNPTASRLGVITPLAKKYKMYSKKDRNAIKTLIKGYYETKQSIKK
jgi:hypothetical protein